MTDLVLRGIGSDRGRYLMPGQHERDARSQVPAGRCASHAKRNRLADLVPEAQTVHRKLTLSREVRN